MSQFEIRPADHRDVEAITNIYSHHVLHGTASFEEVPPLPHQMVERMDGLLERGYPWLVGELDRQVAGYAYSSPYKERSAYRFTVEDSVYISEKYYRCGLGRGLLSALIEACSNSGFQQMMAAISGSESHASVALHSALGFRQVGMASKIGFKHGQHWDVVYMQRSLSQ